MANIFGIIVSGRLLIQFPKSKHAKHWQNYTSIESNIQNKHKQQQSSRINTQCLLTIPEADSINYVVVFLTGAAPLPAGAAGMVYWSWPDPTAPPNWQLLGHISNSKPSAIFKISNLKKLHELSAENQFSSALGQQSICHSAQIGVAIEPEANVQLLASSVAQEQQNNYVTFAQKMLESLVNYVGSFAVTQEQMTPTPGVSYIPLSTLQNWYQNFERRLQQNPNFWKN